MQRLQDKVALVTGASRGIGRAIALRLAQEGARVAVNYRSQEAAAAAVVAEIVHGGGQALALAADVSQAEPARRLVEDAQKHFGRLDILVNNAGVVRDNLLLTMDDDEWRQVQATNLDSCFYCCRAAARFMLRQRSGRIINISSAAGEKPNRGQVNYAASKGGINALTRALAAELAPKNITVNAVAPGMIETEMSREVRELAGDKILPYIMLNRYGRPEDIAAAVAFLASPDADYITGEVLRVDGGLRG
ncbi:MAG TPA: 3-oxoacyl-[acyl-carrier-protein] reductase [Terriglobales bacterium]|nr:3-oxoacyl-[acyl-carrier-protein] reductase [Terriglobales bacterium]